MHSTTLLETYFGFALHPTQRRIARSRKRFKTIVAGRRFGKTTLVAATELLPMLMKRGKRIWIVAPTYALAEKSFREIARYCSNHRAFFTAIKLDAMRIESRTGSFLEAKSADNPTSLIGEGLDLLIIDECALIPDRVFFESLRPTLADRKGKGVFISTPKSRNWFFALYHAGVDGSDEVDSFRFSSYTNAYIEKKEIERTKQTLPEDAFRREFLAEFTFDNDTYFKDYLAHIRPKRAVTPDESVSIGVDLARKSDYTAFVALSRETGEMLEIERMKGLSWAEQTARLTRMIRAYRDAVVYADSTGVGDPIVEQIARAGIPIKGVVFSAREKEHLVEHLALLFDEGRISVLDDETLLHEIASFGLIIGKNGHRRYAGLNGAHDDTVMALALAAKGISAFGDEYDTPSVAI